MVHVHVDDHLLKLANNITKQNHILGTVEYKSVEPERPILDKQQHPPTSPFYRSFTRALVDVAATNATAWLANAYSKRRIVD